MNHRMLISCAAFAGLSSATASAQSTIGEVLDAGGKKLTKDEVVAAIVGGNVSGPTQSGGDLQIDFKADGTLAGNLVAAQGTRRNGGMYGKWTIDDSGKLCTDLTTSRNGTKQVQNCSFLFKVRDQYFVAFDNDDRATRVLPRTIKK